jgi:Cu2+-exporting ATPase
VPPGLVEPGEELQFCCRGCRTVYAVIQGCGLDRFYRLREAAPGEAQPARTTQRGYAEFDDDTFRTLYYRPLADGATATEFYLEGVHCAACVWLVEKLPQVLPGVIEARLDMRRAIVEIRWDAPPLSIRSAIRPTRPKTSARGRCDAKKTIASSYAWASRQPAWATS